MTVDPLANELHELKRRRETPLPLIEMFDKLLSLPRTERKTEAQAIRRDHGYGIETVGTQGRLTATGGWRRRQRTIMGLLENKRGLVARRVTTGRPTLPLSWGLGLTSWFLKRL
jgi:hypothetical protein